MCSPHLIATRWERYASGRIASRPHVGVVTAHSRSSQASSRAGISFCRISQMQDQATAHPLAATALTRPKVLVTSALHGFIYGRITSATSPAVAFGSPIVPQTLGLVRKCRRLQSIEDDSLHRCKKKNSKRRLMQLALVVPFLSAALKCLRLVGSLRPEARRSCLQSVIDPAHLVTTMVDQVAPHQSP